MIDEVIAVDEAILDNASNDAIVANEANVADEAVVANKANDSDNEADGVHDNQLTELEKLDEADETV